MAVPSDFTGLKIWLKADAGAGSSDSDPVSTWTDQSGTSHSFTGASTARPLYRTNVRNGLPVVRFDGSNDELTGGDLSAVFTTGATVLAAADITNGLGKSFIYDQANHDTHWDFGGAGYWGPFRSARLSNTPSSGLPTTGWHYWSMTANNGTVYKMWADGVNKINDLAGFTFEGGTSHNIGHQRTAYFQTMDLGELIVYDNVLSDADRQAVEAYLVGRWFTTAASVTTTVVPAVAAAPAATKAAGASVSLAAVAAVTATPSVTVLAGPNATPATVAAVAAVPAVTVVAIQAFGRATETDTAQVIQPLHAAHGSGSGGSAAGVTDYWTVEVV